MQKVEEWCEACKAKKKCTVDWEKLEENTVAPGTPKRKFVKGAAKESPPEKAMNRGDQSENSGDEENVMSSQEMDQDEVDFGATASSSSPIRETNGGENCGKLQESLSVPSLQVSLVGGLSETASSSKSAGAILMEDTFEKLDGLDKVLRRASLSLKNTDDTPEKSVSDLEK